MGGDSYLLLAGKITNQSLTSTDFSKRVFDFGFFLCFSHAGVEWAQVCSFLLLALKRIV